MADAVLSKKTIFTSLPVPQLFPEQLTKFNKESVSAKGVRVFNPRTLYQSIKISPGKEVVAVDIGGNKIAAATYKVSEGRLWQIDTPKELKSTNGSGYLGFLEEVLEESEKKELPVGIAFPGAVEDNSVIDDPNVRNFTGELAMKYDSNFGNIYPRVTVSNDCEAGLMAGAIHSIKNFPRADEVIFVVNGSGLNTAVLKNNQTFSMESGHIEIVEELNKFERKKPCLMFGNQYVCLERVGGGRAGIEDIWLEETKEKKRGQQIAESVLTGSDLALDIFDNSALIVAHMIAGVVKAFDLMQMDGATTVVCHGGIFKNLDYGARVKQIIDENIKVKANWLYTKDFTADASLDGAAIAALTI